MHGSVGSNQILLLVVLLLVSGLGTYVTYVRQQSTLDSLAEKIEIRHEEKEEIESLRQSRAQNKKRLASARADWNERYKKVPDTVRSTTVVAYLSRLTQTGFHTFDITAAGPTQRDGYSAYRVSAEGKAYFLSLYRLVWRLENSRPFYRVRDLQLRYLEERTTDPEKGSPSLDVLVSFQMTIEAIYGIVDAPPRPLNEPPADQALPVVRDSGQLPVPSDVLPNPSPDIDPFYPLVFEDVPPNEEGRLDVETAEFVSIIDEHAVFATDRGMERVGEGDRVYLGTIVEVDAAAGRVVARLNRGGIIERVERQLTSDRPARESSPDGPR